MSPPKVREKLEKVREAGFAVDDEELAAGLYAIAAPVRNESRDVTFSHLIRVAFPLPTDTPETFRAQAAAL